jgi:DNA-binding NtrC family response regulator
MSHPFRRAVEPDEVPVLFAGAELADAPPFGPQFIPAEQRILGARHVYQGPILSLVGDFGPLDNLGNVVEILRALVEKVRERLLGGAVATDEEKRAYVKAVLLVLYSEVDEPLLVLAETNVMAPGVYRGFVARRAHFLEIEGLVVELPGARILFAVFYQVRRAYFIIHTTLLGISPASGELRNRVWYTLFPAGDLFLHAMWGYANRSDVTVLILGETGTGKEGVAWALSYGRWIPCDDQGRFKDRPDQGFHAINLAGLSDTLADAQLVGFPKGAFTGALKNTPGALDQCAAGRNLFIDEVGAASLAIQNKLLRIVEEKKFTPLGSIEQVLVLGRLIFAAQRSQLVSANVSRDLRYRMCTNMIDVPSLRARIDGHPDELAFFVRRFAQKASGPQAARTVAETLALIQAKYPNHRWGGNMRELLACVENVATHRELFVPPNSVAATSVAQGTPMRAATLPPGPMPGNDRTVVSAGDALAHAVKEGSLFVKEAERQYILHVFELVGRNYKEAARRLGIGWRKVRDTVENKAAAAAGDAAEGKERGEEEGRASARGGR